MTRKTLSYLIESELEKAEVILAAKAISNKLQQMAENLAKMDASDVMPLGDAMREIFGADQAASFEQHVSETLRDLTEKVRAAKNSISDQLDALEKGEPMNDMANTEHEDMFPDQGGGDQAPQMGGADDQGDGSDMFGQQHDAGSEEGSDDDMADLFGGDAEEANSAGRETKESVASTKKVLEGVSADYRLTREFAGLIREGKKPREALNIVAEAYAMDQAAVAEIITSVKKANS